MNKNNNDDNDNDNNNNDNNNDICFQVSFLEFRPAVNQ